MDEKYYEDLLKLEDEVGFGLQPLKKKDINSIESEAEPLIDEADRPLRG